MAVAAMGRSRRRPNVLSQTFATLPPHASALPVRRPATGRHIQEAALGGYWSASLIVIG